LLNFDAAWWLVSPFIEEEAKEPKTTRQRRLDPEAEQRPFFNLQQCTQLLLLIVGSTVSMASATPSIDFCSLFRALDSDLNRPY
jgi:hypothetical protein